MSRALEAPTPDAVITILTGEISKFLDLTLFSGRWNLEPER
jgi:hypothetical protein